VDLHPHPKIPAPLERPGHTPHQQPRRCPDPQPRSSRTAASGSDRWVAGSSWASRNNPWPSQREQPLLLRPGQYPDRAVGADLMSQPPLMRQPQSPTVREPTPRRPNNPAVGRTTVRNAAI
jgi:hypothetical protein